MSVPSEMPQVWKLDVEDDQRRVAVVIYHKQRHHRRISGRAESRAIERGNCLAQRHSEPGHEQRLFGPCKARITSTPPNISWSSAFIKPTARRSRSASRIVFAEGVSDEDNGKDHHRAYGPVSSGLKRSIIISTASEPNEVRDHAHHA